MNPASPPSDGKVDRGSLGQHRKGPRRDFLLHALQKLAARVGVVFAKGHGAADHHALRIDRVHGRDDADAQVAGRFQNDLQRQRIAALGFFVDHQGRQFFAGGDPRRERAVRAWRPAALAVRLTTAEALA